MAAESRAAYLMERYFSRTCSEAERRELLELIVQDKDHEAIKAFMDASVDRLSDSYRLGPESSRQILNAILGETEAGSQRRQIGRRWIGWAAAVLVLAAGAGTLLIRKRTGREPTVAAVRYKGDVVPGHTGAVLHLSDGRTVVLDSVQNGEIARQGTVQVIKENGTLKYVGKPAQVVYNTITTNRGRQWRLLLPDGTRVWLNASSSIHYPLRFTGKERRVEISGEAYFEVVHNAQMPFRVQVNGAPGGQEGLVEDVGTAFNINAYGDEPAMKTTLVEGAATVNGAILKPGQQAVVSGREVRVAEGNIQQALAWKNGFFGFEHADIHAVMRQLSRWYDVEVKFEGEPDNTPFQGKIGRELTLAQVLKGLEQVHVHFRIEEDKRIVILPGAGQQ